MPILVLTKKKGTAQEQEISKLGRTLIFAEAPLLKRKMIREGAVDPKTEQWGLRMLSTGGMLRCSGFGNFLEVKRNGKGPRMDKWPLNKCIPPCHVLLYAQCVDTEALQVMERYITACKAPWKKLGRKPTSLSWGRVSEPRGHHWKRCLLWGSSSRLYRHKEVIVVGGEVLVPCVNTSLMFSLISVVLTTAPLLPWLDRSTIVFYCNLQCVSIFLKTCTEQS